MPMLSIRLASFVSIWCSVWILEGYLQRNKLYFHSVIANACAFKRSIETTCRVSSCVDSSRIGHAIPASAADFHVLAQTHHWSPGFKPGNLYCGDGVIKSLPLNFANSRNSCVTWQHTVWSPWSDLSVLQQPSLNHPVRGDSEQVWSSVPMTLYEGSMCLVNWGLVLKSCIWTS